jgi:hypothetical protein
MTKMTRIASLVTGIASLLFACASFADNKWATYHWERSSNPLAKELGDNTTSQWYDSLIMSWQDWDSSSVLDLTIASGGVKNPKRCTAKNGTIEICNARYGFNGWLGVASITVSGGHITSGVVKLNDAYFDTSTYDHPEWRNSVMCQEIGHVWGLGHQDEDFGNTPLLSCMDYSDPPWEHPNVHDFDMLLEIYGHDDSSDDGGGSEPKGCNPKSPKCNANGNAGGIAAEVLELIDMAGPAQWGRLISEHGLQEVFELDFGGGNKVITFVTWTLERAGGPHDTH